ncbi:MAG: hypothetical protein WC935_05235 [Thermoleophilia bacterium]
MTSNKDSDVVAALAGLGEEIAAGSLTSRAFNVHGVKTRLVTNSGEVALAMENFFRAFKGSADDEPDIVVNLFVVDALDDRMAPIPPDATMLYDWGMVKVYHSGHLRYQKVDARARIAADVERRVSVGFAEKELLQSDWVISNLFFYPLWGQLLKECGLFPLHAAGLVKKGRASLLLGRSGSGKSTLSLHLVRNGFGILSDDTVFLKESDGIIEAFSFPEEINVSEQTIKLIPELSRVQKFTVNELRNKSSFSIEEIYPDCVVDFATPAVMVFPRIAETETTVAEPMSRTEALALSMRYGFFFLDPSTTGRHFEILSILAKQTNCYRLYSGRDQEELERVVAGLLENEEIANQSYGERKE